MLTEKECYFVTFVITLFSNFLCFSSTNENVCQTCRVQIYNHNAKFSLHAKMSVIILSFIINKVSSGQPGKLQINILIYSSCSISYRSLHLLISLISLFFCFVPSRHYYKIIASSFTYAV